MVSIRLTLQSRDPGNVGAGRSADEGEDGDGETIRKTIIMRQEETRGGDGRHVTRDFFGRGGHATAELAVYLSLCPPHSLVSRLGPHVAMASSLSKGSLFSAVRSNTAVSHFYFPAVPGSCQCRFFSQSSQRNGRQAMNMDSPKVPTPLKPSTATRGSMMSRSELPTDLGLLPGTFIRPLWRDLPSIFTHPKERLQLEWLWLKSGFQSFARYAHLHCA